MPPDSVLYSGGFDLKDAFYQLELPLHLRPYFCLPDCPASFCPSLAARGHTMVTPRLRVIPMGWSHALNVCQELFVALIRDSLGAEGDLFDDYRPTPLLRGTVVSCYVDNFGVMSTDPVKVRKAVEKVREVAEARGLDYHELEMCREGFEHLGMEGTVSGLITVKGKRRCRLYQCLRHVLRRKIVLSKQMERIVG